jgi:Domain of unknown function (DUF1906)
VRNFLRLVFSFLMVLATPAMAAPSCNTHKEFTAVDLSQTVTSITTISGKSGVDAFKSIGIKTIARYYDWPAADITCKSLLPAESDAIIAAGLNIVTIFQHENSDPETFFDAGRGVTDAKAALKMAAANGQPSGSAIYFAVDGVDQTVKDAVFEFGVSNGKSVSKARRQRLLKADPSFRKHIAFYERFLQYHKAVFRKPVSAIRASDMLPAVERYFRAVKANLNGKYKVGVYGSGLVCKHIMAKGLADYCWLAMSTGWPGYKEQRASGKWSLAQQHTTYCKNWKFRERETARFDFNRVKGADFGQWSKKGEVTKLPILPAKCRLGW